MDMASVLERIDQRLEELGLTATEASRKATGSPDTIRNWRRAVRDGKAVGASTTSLIPLAVILRTSVPWLVDGISIEDAAPRVADETRLVTVAAHVQAGYWAETWEWGDEEKYQIPIPNLPQFRHFTLYAAETRGPSMNRRYPEGTVVIFTNAIETDEPVVPGKRYVVERRKADGRAEHTVKLLHRDEAGGMWLVPESTDPLFQAPIPLLDDPGPDDEIRIVGRVRYSVSIED